MAYTKTTWVNGSEPSINAENLNKIEQGISDASTIYGTVADIIAADLQVDDVVSTSGYTSVGDGGSATYIIRAAGSFTPDGYGDHTLSNTLIAEMMIGEFINPLQFGAINDGVTDSTAAINAAGARKRKILFPYQGNFKISGSSNITFNASVDFNDSRIDVSEYVYPYRINFGTDSTVTNHNSSSTLVTQLATDAEITGRYWSGWLNNTDIAESFILIDTDQPYFTYRNNTVNRRDYNYVTRLGQVLSTPLFPLDTSTVTNIKQIKVNKQYTTYENMVLVYGSNDSNSAAIVCTDCTKLRIKNISYLIDPDFIGRDRNPALLSISESYDVIVDGLDMSFPLIHADAGITLGVPGAQDNAGFNYTYGLNIGACYNVQLKNIVGQGDGWGATGNYSVQRISFENCELNRVDFHQPFLELCTIDKCNIGNTGIRATGIGDMVITRTVFANNEAAHMYPQTFITSRPDTIGFCNGNLTMRDCVINLHTTTHIASSKGDVAQTHPVGSPFEPAFWYNETYENITVVPAVEGNRLEMGTVYDANAGLRISKRVIIDNVRGPISHNYNSNWDAKPALDLYLDPTLSPVPQIRRATPNREIIIKNTTIDIIHQITRDDTFKYNYIIDNVSNTDQLGTHFKIVSAGSYNVNNSVLEGFSFLSGTGLDKEIVLRVTGNQITHTGAYDTRPIQFMSTSFAKAWLINNYIDVRDSGAVFGSQAIGSCILNNNVIATNGGVPNAYYPFPTYVVDDVNKIITIPAQFLRDSNPIDIITNDGATDTRKTRIYIPETDSTTSADIDGTNTLTMTDTAGVVTYDIGVLNFVEARIVV